MHAGNRLGDVGYAIQSVAEPRGYGVIRDLVSHGVGRQMHEDPQIPNYGKAGSGVRLQPGMVFAIEPMITLGDYDIISPTNGMDGPSTPPTILSRPTTRTPSPSPTTAPGC